jgi:hypothetical protein
VSSPAFPPALLEVLRSHGRAHRKPKGLSCVGSGNGKGSGVVVVGNDGGGGRGCGFLSASDDLGHILCELPLAIAPALLPRRPREAGAAAAWRTPTAGELHPHSPLLRKLLQHGAAGDAGVEEDDPFAPDTPTTCDADAASSMPASWAAACAAHDAAVFAPRRVALAVASPFLHGVAERGDGGGDGGNAGGGKGNNGGAAVGWRSLVEPALLLDDEGVDCKVEAGELRYRYVVWSAHRRVMVADEVNLADAGALPRVEGAAPQAPRNAFVRRAARVEAAAAAAAAVQAAAVADEEGWEEDLR